MKGPVIPNIRRVRSLSMNILMVDNYDSFTYNLVQYIGEVSKPPEVIRNDVWNLDDVRKFAPDAIVISPGPGHPDDAGISLEIIRQLGSSTPILGVCLGHQCIASAYGGTIRRAERLLHGKTSKIFHSDSPLYRDLPNPFTATRYHSLIVEDSSLPEVLTVDAVSEQDEIMGLHHTEFPVLGVQFHPESILTQDGRRLIRNFLDFARSPQPLGTGRRPRIPEQSREEVI